MSIKEKLRKKKVASVQYAVSPQGLHVQVNGYQEFVIPKAQLMLINGKVFDNEIKEKDENNNNPSKQGEVEVS